jgi:hypothetical protein
MEGENGALPEARLWQAVITTAIQEWVSGPRRKQRVAEQYLFNDDSDFRFVCQSAGMDPDFLRGRLLKIRRQTTAQANCQLAA